MRSMKLIIVTVMMALIIITHTACGQKEPVSKTDFCLDTNCEITIYENQGDFETEKILDEAFEVIRDYEQLLSKTKKGSDVSLINEAGGQWIEVSEETVEVINMANTISAESGGAFDITIGAVTELWDFKSGENIIPDEGDIAAALPHVNYEAIIAEESRVLLTDSSAVIDLGGVAKGCIADKVCAFMEEKGVTRAVINLGGNVVALGEKEEGTPWNIGIERPFTDRTELIGKIQVADATVVTSGIYERNFEKDGKIYHHILDPETGYPAETDLEAVTLTAAKGNSGFCDAVSTACLILGRDGAVKLVENLQKRYPDKRLEGAFIDNNGDIVQTDGMEIIL